MTYVGGVLSFLAVAFWVYCLVDVATTPAGQARYLNKWFWFGLVVFFSLAGSVGWIVFGRPGRVPAGVGGTAAPSGPGPAPDDARKPPSRSRRPAVLAPDDDPAFLRRLDEIAELERRARGDGPPGGPPGTPPGPPPVD